MLGYAENLKLITGKTIRQSKWRDTACSQNADVVAALSIITEKWKQHQCPSADEQINRV